MYTLEYSDCLPHKDRFEAKINRSGGPDACHPHTAHAQNADGYGAMGMWVGNAYKNVRLHRIAYVFATGESLHSSEQIDHFVCNNPRCANPAHLRKTDARGNAATRTPSARSAGRIGRRLFTNDEVMVYRRRWAAGESLSSLAHDAGVRTSVMGKLVRGTTYKHLPVLERSPQFTPRNSRSCLTVGEVAVIKGRLLAGEPRAALAREYGVTRDHIGRIYRGERWRHVKPAVLERTMSLAVG